MEKALAKKSDYIKVKSKFFINRLVTYFSFLLIPLWMQKTVELNLFIQSLIILLYLMFMVGQWYLMGKEIDHRLKIYYRANSSMDRIVYRLLSGNIFLMLIFNVFYLFPDGIAKVLFWTFFIFVGLFYSWPTRGKIIEESMAGQFGEFRFLDSFERTVLLLIVILFVISLPEIPLFQNIEALKLFFDPNESIHSIFWNFLSVNYIPFNNLPKLFNLAWSLHIYFFGVGTFLLAFYCLLRFFFSRRLAILGVFAVISSWSFSKILGYEFITALKTTFPLLSIWAYLWCSKSATYRSGLMMGLIFFLGTMFDMAFALLFPVYLLGILLISFKSKTKWYKLQWLKYTLMGFVLVLSLIFSHNESSQAYSGFHFMSLVDSFADLIYRKAFFSISFIGILMYIAYLFKFDRTRVAMVTFDGQKVTEFTYSIIALIVFGIFLNDIYIKDFTAMWMLTFFALVPLEWVFQSMSRLRSKRNIIYALYILVCLLDSHVEGRVRIIGKMFLDDEVFKYINQM